MVNYSCEICGKKFSHKNSYEYHKNKKKVPCVSNSVSNYSCVECNKVFVSQSNLTRHIKMYCKYGTVSEANICTHCGKSFTRKDSLKKHLEVRCKVKKKIDKNQDVSFKILLDQMEQLKQHTSDEINKLKIENSKLINNITFNSTHNNTINITNFGEESYEHITDKVCRKLLRSGFSCIPKMTEYVHFNENNPHMHNVYISNMKDKYAMIKEGNSWTIKLKSEVLDQLYNDKLYYLEGKYKDMQDVLDSKAKDMFSRFISKHKDENIQIWVKHETKLVLYNNRDMPINTKKCLQ